MNKGFILIIVLSLLGIMALLSFVLVSSSRQQSQLSQNYLNQVRAKVLAFSGSEWALRAYKNNFMTFNQQILTLPIGEGTYIKEGDLVHLEVKDSNGKININDGILGGTPDVPSYVSIALDPYPQGQAFPLPDDGTSEADYISSAWHNLRLRRLLNAYGDAHRFIDQVYEGDPENVSQVDFYKKALPNSPFSISAYNSSDADSGEQTLFFKQDSSGDWVIDEEKNTGLGDHIISNRPVGGYENLEEIKDIVNAWARHPSIDLSLEYLGSQTFFELIANDLVVKSYEDDRLLRIDKESNVEINLGFDVLNFAADLFFEQQYGKLDYGSFYPRDSLLNNYGLLFGGLWRPTAAALINLNQASFFVKAAVFYAPTNVFYTIEGATTVPPYLINNGLQEFFPNQHTGTEAMQAYPSIGLIPPVFHPSRASRENGLDQGRQTHLMSMRDALHLANAYEKYDKPINTFDDFETFLKNHEISGIIEGMIPAYERVLTRDEFGQVYVSGGLDGEDFNAGGSFIVAPYESSGIFGQEYIAKTLPHILSGVRRIPSYLGAPVALQDPYIVHKPDYDSELYKRGLPSFQGFRKVEDFCSRAIHPKVCFFPGGTISFACVSELLNVDRQILATSQIKGVAEVFQVRYFRDHEKFHNFTFKQDGNPYATHQDIYIGPISRSYTKEYGFVGLRDYADDLREDPFMNQQSKGYHPQIVMNFAFDRGEDPTDAEDDVLGYDNFSEEDISPSIYDANDDLWLQALENYYPNLGDMLFPFTESNFAASLSSFSGAWLFKQTSTTAGEFPSRWASHNYFSGYLYWRLGESIEGGDGGGDDVIVVGGEGGEGDYGGLARPGPQGDRDPEQEDDLTDPGWLQEDIPIGESLSRGVMTFWFQIPSGYDYPTQVRTAWGTVIESKSFSRVIAQLNVWERFQYGPEVEKVHTRPVCLTVGLKKTERRGLNLFARYDSGGEHHNGFPTFPYAGAFPYSDADSLEFSVYDNALDSQYDFLGLWNSKDEDYIDYRRIAHRSAEVSVKLANKPECGLGTWHRASFYWNLGWEDGFRSIKEQLYLDLHDDSNKDGDNVIYQGATYAFDDYAQGDFFDYPSDDEVAYGFMFPFNPSMILSIGESHAMRLGVYERTYFDLQGGSIIDYQTSTQPGKIYTGWRFGSGIDNIRVYMGPKVPLEGQQISDLYFRPSFVSSTTSSNPYGALRYKVIGGSDFSETVEPTWVIDPNQDPESNELPPGSKLLSVGARIYYPPDSADPPNTSYVYLSAGNDDADADGVPQPFEPTVVSQNEQNMIYPAFETNKNFKIRLQYTSYKPILDGDLSNREAERIIYRGSDHFTEIPWIKEVSFRYIPPSGVNLLEWEER